MLLLMKTFVNLRYFSPNSVPSFSHFFWYFQVLKVVIIIGIFICIFFGTILSKMTVLLAAVNVRTDTPLYCIQYNSTTDNYAQCVTLWNNQSIIDLTSYNQTLSCLTPRNDATDSVSRSGQYYGVCEAVAIRWIWSLTLILLTPEVFVFIRSLSTMCFKREKTPTASLFLTVSLFSFCNFSRTQFFL